MFVQPDPPADPRGDRQLHRQAEMSSPTSKPMGANNPEGVPTPHGGDGAHRVVRASSPHPAWPCCDPHLEGLREGLERPARTNRGGRHRPAGADAWGSSTPSGRVLRITDDIVIRLPPRRPSRWPPWWPKVRSGRPSSSAPCRSRADRGGRRSQPPHAPEDDLFPAETAHRPRVPLARPRLKANVSNAAQGPGALPARPFFFLAALKS